MAIFVPLFFFLVIPILALVHMDRAVENDPRDQDAIVEDGKKVKQGDVEANQTRTNKANLKVQVQHHSYEGSTSGVKNRADAISEHGAGNLQQSHSYAKSTSKGKASIDTPYVPLLQDTQNVTSEPHVAIDISNTDSLQDTQDVTSESHAATALQSIPPSNSNQTAERTVPQPAQQQTDSQYQDKKDALKFSYWVTTIAFAALLSLLSVLFGDERGLTHEFLFKACTVLIIATLFSGLALMLLAFIDSITYRLVIILKVIKYSAMGFLTSAALLASIIFLQKFM